MARLKVLHRKNFCIVIALSFDFFNTNNADSIYVLAQHGRVGSVYLYLMQTVPILALWIGKARQDMFEVLNESAPRNMLRLFPSYFGKAQYNCTEK